jgi:hypothetical protein
MAMAILPYRIDRMLLRAITDGSVSGTGTMSVQGRILGGVLITADGTNDATVVVRQDNASGAQIFEVATKTSGLFAGPISLNGSQTAHYSVSGTGAAAQFYEWVE